MVINTVDNHKVHAARSFGKRRRKLTVELGDVGETDRVSGKRPELSQHTFFSFQGTGVLWKQFFKIHCVVVLGGLTLCEFVLKQVLGAWNHCRHQDITAAENQLILALDVTRPAKNQKHSVPFSTIRRDQRTAITVRRVNSCMVNHKIHQFNFGIVNPIVFWLSLHWGIKTDKSPFSSLWIFRHFKKQNETFHSKRLDVRFFSWAWPSNVRID